MRHEQKLHGISILSGVFVVVIAFFAFGLGDPLLSDLHFTPGSNVWYVNPKPDPAQVTADTVEEVEEIVLQQAEPNQVQNHTIQKTRIKAEPTINDLEQRMYVFDGQGEIFQTSSQKKPAAISMSLKPLPGSLLKEFEITSGKLTVDKYGIPINGGLVTFLDDNTINMELADGAMSPKGTLQGQSEDLLLNDSDNNVQIVFSRQQIFLSDGDSIPYYFSVLGSLRMD